MQQRTLIVPHLRRSGLNDYLRRFDSITVLFNEVESLRHDVCKLLYWGLVDRESVPESIDSGSILGLVELKTIKIGIHSFPSWHSAKKEQNEVSTVCGRQMVRRQLDAEMLKESSLSLSKGNLVNKEVITIFHFVNNSNCWINFNPWINETCRKNCRP